MNKIQQSLQDNMQDILANLPEEHHEGCKQQIQKACELPVMSDDEANAAIIQALPDERAAEFKQNPTAFRADPNPTLEEQKAAVLDALESDEHKQQFEANWESQLRGYNSGC